MRWVDRSMRSTSGRDVAGAAGAAGCLREPRRTVRGTHGGPRAGGAGIRIAIRSSRWKIVRQLLTESVTMALMGGAGAAMMSAMLTDALTRWHPANLGDPGAVSGEAGCPHLSCRRAARGTYRCALRLDPSPAGMEDRPERDAEGSRKHRIQGASVFRAVSSACGADRALLPAGRSRPPWPYADCSAH